MVFLISVFKIIISIFVGALIGFFGPFIIAQFDGNPAWSFVTMITVPIGMLIGLVVGVLIIIYK
jgi:uncharacterized membrane protein